MDFKNRDSARNIDLSQLLGSLGVGSQHPNPDVPLHFEQAGKTHDPAWEAELSYSMCDIGGESSLWLATVDKEIEIESSAWAAMVVAFQAWGYVGRDPNKASEVALEALNVDPRCPDAYSILAQCQATSYEDALELYKKAEVAAKDMVIDFENFIKTVMGRVWDCLILRPLFRAVHGQANTLRKMRRWKESLAKYLLLEQYDTNWYTSRSTYVNYRYHVPAVYLGVNNTEMASRYLAKWAEKGYSLNSTAVCWNYTRALLDFKESDGKRGCEFESYIHYADIPGKAALLMALQNHPAVLEYLTGRREMPSGHLPLTMSSDHALTHAVNYVRAYGEFWKATPGAIEWAQKNSNTFFTLLIFREPKIDQFHGKGRQGAINLYRDVATLRRLCTKNGGIYPNVSVDFHGATILAEAVCTSLIPERKKPAFVSVLLEAGCDPSIRDSEGLTPVHKVCYYDFGIEILRQFLNTGFDACADGASVPSPLRLSINQGNWRPLQTILASLPRGSPYLSPQKLFAYYCEIGVTSVYECVRGGRKCERCMYDSHPHSKHVSFEKVVDVLINFGLNPSLRSDRMMAKHPLDSYAKAQAAKRKAAASSSTNASAPAQTERRVPCAVCNREGPDNKACGGCKQVFYCSREHQAQHWKAHKPHCQMLHLKGEG